MPRQAVTLIVVGIACLAFIVFLAYFSSFAQGLQTVKISPSSGPQCEAELISALNAHAEHSGLDFEASTEHARSVLTTGTVDIAYARDGVRYEVSFGATMPEETCQLTFYQRKRQERGSRESVLGDFASLTLSECECESPPTD